MFPASTNGGGQVMSPGPLDVCKTPSPAGPIPLPYPNMGMCTQASGTSTKVVIASKDTVVVGSKISMTSMDEPGVAGGVVSSQNMGSAEFKMGSSKVKAEGKKVCHLLSMAGQNGNNANFPPGMQIAPSQTKVIVMP